MVKYVRNWSMCAILCLKRIENAQKRHLCSFFSMEGRENEHTPQNMEARSEECKKVERLHDDQPKRSLKTRNRESSTRFLVPHRNRLSAVMIVLSSHF